RVPAGWIGLLVGHGRHAVGDDRIGDARIEPWLGPRGGRIVDLTARNTALGLLDCLGAGLLLRLGVLGLLLGVLLVVATEDEQSGHGEDAGTSEQRREHATALGLGIRGRLGVRGIHGSDYSIALGSASFVSLRSVREWREQVSPAPLTGADIMAGSCLSR